MRRFSFIERLIAVCCILAIMLSFPWTPVSAEAETGIRVTASTNASVKQGNSANAYVYIDSMESLSTLEVTVHFDPAVVQVTGSYNKVEALIYDSATTDGTLQYTYIFDGNGPNAKTQLFYFQYVVKQDAPVGDSYFDIVVGDAYDASFNTLPVSGSRCSFRVAETVTNLTCSLRGTSSVETAINQEFTLTYSFNTTSIASGSVAIRYDPELFAVSEVVQGSFLTDKMTDINTTLSGAVYLSFLGAQYGSGSQLLTLRMKTLQNVSQLSPVTVTVTDLYDLQLNPITCSGYTTPVRVTYDPAVDESAPYVFLEQDYDGDAQTVTVRVCLEENAHLGAGDFVLQFDTERLAYKSAAKGYSPTFFNINDKNTDEGLLKFSIISLKDMTEAVTMLTATFQVLTPCEDTATQLQISGSGLANHLTDPIVLNFTGCTVETAGHTVVVDQAVAPDCLNTGLTEGSHCAVCEKILVAQNVVDALGHDEIPHEALAPTCTEIGWDAYNTCSRCDYTTYVEIPANGHTFQKGVCTVCGADQDPGNTWDISEAADGSLMAKLYLNADGTYDLQLTGSGPMTSWTDASYVPWYSYRQKITSLQLPEGLQSIGSYAFYYCAALTEFTLPAGIQTIGSYAFIGCSGVTELTIPESLQALGNYAFYNCRNLTQINLNAANLVDLSSDNNVFSYAGQSGDGITVSVGNNVTKIPAYLFYPYGSSDYTPKITAVEFAEGSVCQTIGSYAFRGCTGIRSLTLPEGLQTVGSYAFIGCSGVTELSIPESLQALGNYAFYNCRNLTQINLNAANLVGLSSDNNVFSYAGQSGDGITVSVGNNVTKIPAYLFYPYGSSDYTPKITTVEFAEGSVCQTIGSYAFCGCTGISSLTLPEGLQTIDSGAFYGCTGIGSLTLQEDLQTIGSYAFYGCTGITELTLPEGLQSIESYAFYDCTGIRSLALPEGLQAISSYAFYGCTDLTELTLPEGLQSIGDHAFYGCTGLIEITLPESLQTVGGYAFHSCRSLEKINFNAISLPDLSSNNHVFSYAGQDGNGVTVSVGSSVARIPAYLFYPYGNSNYTPKITVVEFAEGSCCQSIGEWAFYDCTSLTELTLPESLQTIGNYAFYNSTSLNRINFNAASLADLSDYNYVFSYAGQGGDGITVSVGSSVTKIPAYLFCPYIYGSYMPKITIVEFAEGSVCQTIGNYAFYNCGSLTGLELPEGLRTIGSRAFCNCAALTGITLPESLETIGSYAFYNCKSLIWVNFNAANLADLGYRNYVFSYAGQNGSGIHVRIGSHVTKIPAYLFYPESSSGCSPKIISVVFEEGSVCQQIGASAFYQNEQLIQFCIPECVTEIGSNAFSYCSKLVITLEADALPASLGSSWNGSSTYILGVDRVVWRGRACFVVLKNGSAVLARYYGEEAEYAIADTIENAPVVSIHEKAFYGNTSLQAVQWPESLESIGNFAFYGCTSLKEVVLAEGVTTIGRTAFFGCTAVETLVLPGTLQTIGSSAFYGCTALTEIRFNALQMTDLAYDNGVFTNAGKAGDGITLTVGCLVTRIPAYLCYPGTGSGSTPKLTKIVFEDGSICESIGDTAFAHNLSLLETKLPATVKQIGSTAFGYCENLILIFEANTLPETLGSGWATDVTYYLGAPRIVTVGDGRYTIVGEAYTILSQYDGDGDTFQVEAQVEGIPVTKIDSRVFENRTKLTSVTLPESLQTIGDYAFYGCTGLAKLNIPDSLQTVGQYAFYDNDGLTKLTLPEGLREIGQYAFYGCGGLTEITLPEGLETIGNYAFFNCRDLTRINYNAASLTDLSDYNYVFSYAGQNGDGITVLVGASVTKIPARLFYPYNGTSYIPKITAVEFAEGSALQSIGNYAFYNCTGIVSLTLPEGLQSIGSYAFYNCTSLTELTLPESLQTIEKYAFYNGKSLIRISFNATSLTNLISDNHVFSYAGQNGDGITVSVGASVTKIPAYLFYPYGDSSYAPKITAVEFAQNGVLQSIGNRAFSGCAGISALTLPEGLQSIGSYAFYGCSVLAELTLPESLQTIGNYAFYNCTGLTKINFNAASMTDLNSSNYVFSYAGQNGNGITVLVGSGVTKIPACLFYPYGDSNYAPKLTAVEFAEGSALQSIGYCSFYNCTGIASLTLPESLQIIDTSAFRGCTGIVSLTLPEGLQTIGDSAFYNCKSLTRITIPESLETLGGSAFQNCTAVTQLDFRAVSMNDFSGSHSTFYQFGTATDGVTVTVGSKVERLPAFLFYGSNAPITAVVFEDGSTCQTVGRYAFYRLASLQSIELPATVQTIGEAAFMQCTGLEAFAMPADLTTIGGSAFSSCTGLRRLHLPEKLTTIGEHAFDSCTGLTEMTLPESLEAIGYSAFYNCKSLTRISFNAASMTDLSSGNYVFYRAGQDGNGITVSVGSSVTRIPAYLFYPYGNSDYTPKITAVEFAEGSVCESIGEQAFYGCAGLTELILPEGLQTIGSYAFYNSTGLTELTLPESLETIGSRAFYNCTSLTRIHFDPANLSDLSSDNDVFRYAGQSGDGITVSVGAGVTRIPAYLFYPLYRNSGYTPKITAVEFAEGSICQSIGACAFYYSASITELALPASVQTIDSNAFYGCSSLRKVTVLSAALAETLTSNNAAGCLIGQAQTVLLPGQVQLSSYLQNKYPNREQIARDGDIYWLLDQNTHSWQETQTLIQRVPCQVDGLVRYTCDHCNTYKDVTVERHTIVTHEAKEPDCETVGWYAYESCAQCAYTTYVEIPALGHWAWQKDTSGAILYTGENDGIYPFTSDGDAFASTNKLDSSTSTYVITVQEACILTVCGKISSETNYDKLFIYHNNAKIAELSGEWDWQSYPLELKAGDTVKITYQKDGSVSVGQDTAWFRLEAEKKILVPVEEAEPTCLDAVVCAVCKKEIKAALGHDEIPHAAQAVTCLEIGWDAYETCSRCDYTTYKEIPALGHGIIKHDAVAPTCLEIGWVAYETCSRCDYTTYAELPALGHGIIKHDAVAPTCLEIGWDAYETCSRCDYTTYAEIAALGHDPVYSHTQQPTCLEVGYDIHQCTRCDYIEKHEIAALGHDPIAHEGREVTCLEIGWDAYETCSRCDYTTYKEIPALGHGIIKHDAVAPTCLEIGWVAYETCSRCDYTTYSEKPATGHWVIDVAAENDPVYPFSFDGEVYASSNHLDNTTSVYTITATRDCTLEFYGKVSSEGNYDKLILRHNNTVITELSGQWDWQQYTLTLIAGDRVTVSYRKDGSASSYQDTAWFRYELAEGDKIPAEDAQPTCRNAVVCSLCGQEQKAALGHDPIAHEAMAPTCEEIGWDAYDTCSRCDYTTYKEIPATGHNFTQTFCTVCGTKQTPLYTWDASAAGDGSLMAYLYQNFVDGGYELEIEGSGAMKDYSYSDMPWYSYRSSINRVSLPEGLTYIGSYAFQYCSILRQIRIPDSVERVGSNAFDYSEKLVIVYEGNNASLAPSYGWYGCGYYFDPQKVILEEDATYVIDKNGNAVLAKYIGTGSEFVARETVDGIPVTQIGRYAFYRKTNLETYWIPERIETIGAYAFSECNGTTLILESEQLPANRGNSWNGSCNYYLAPLRVWEEDGFRLLLDQQEQVHLLRYVGDAKEVLIQAQFGGYPLKDIQAYAFQYTDVEQVTVPDTIQLIESSTFYNCRSLTQVVLPEGLKRIGSNAFYDCSSLLEIQLPESITQIGNNAFWGCSSLKSVVIPDGITTLDSLFVNCYSLESVTIPDSVTTIGGMTFYCCYALKEVKLPKNLRSIGYACFYRCNAMRTLELPEQLHNAGWGSNIQYMQLDVLYIRSSQLAATVTEAVASDTLFQNLKTLVIPTGTGTDYIKNNFLYCETRMRDGVSVDVYSRCAHDWQTEKISAYVKCESDGYEIHTCSLCGVWTDDFTPMHDMEETVIEPTCTEDGYTLHTCADCGATERTDPVNKLGHTRNYGGVLCNRCGEVACLLALKNGDSLFGCGSWQEAMNEAWRGDTLVLYGDITGDVRLYQTMRLDLNGHDIRGTLIVSESATLYGVDSATDDFTGSYGSVAAITGKFLTDSTSVDGKRYIALTGEDGVSFHRLQLQLHTVSLRTSNAGLYYKASLECDEALRSVIVRHGTALSVERMPGADFKADGRYTWTDGAPTGDFTSGSVVNIFRSGLSAQENAARGEMKIYANAYLQLADGTVLMADTTTGDTAGSYGFDGIVWSLRDVLEVLNRDIDDPAYAEHRQQILSFCETWKDALSGWQLENLK